MEILYSDNHIAVCIKPAGVSSEDSGKASVPALLREAGCAESVYTVHRLDKDVSGVMVYAKTSVAAAELTRQITAGCFIKEYTAMIIGAPEHDEGEYRDLLFHDKTKNKSYVVSRMRRGVREAVLHYRTVGGGIIGKTRVTIVKVLLETGRTHQIRVQFSSRGTPIVGDRKYGGGNAPVALTSTRLEFVHPATKKPMRFDAETPDSMPWTEIKEK